MASSSWSPATQLVVRMLACELAAARRGAPTRAAPDTTPWQRCGRHRLFDRQLLGALNASLHGPSVALGAFEHISSWSWLEFVPGPDHVLTYATRHETVCEYDWHTRQHRTITTIPHCERGGYNVHTFVILPVRLVLHYCMPQCIPNDGARFKLVNVDTGRSVATWGMSDDLVQVRWNARSKSLFLLSSHGFFTQWTQNGDVLSLRELECAKRGLCDFAIDDTNRVMYILGASPVRLYVCTWSGRLKRTVSLPPRCGFSREQCFLLFDASTNSIYITGLGEGAIDVVNITTWQTHRVLLPLPQWKFTPLRRYDPVDRMHAVGRMAVHPQTGHIATWLPDDSGVVMLPPRYLQTLHRYTDLDSQDDSSRNSDSGRPEDN